MKNLFIIACIAGVIAFGSCKKNKEVTPTPKEILTKKIADILPKKYLDTLEKLGLKVNQGTNPPDLTGSYMLAPSKLKNSNIIGDYIGTIFHEGYFKLYDQSSADFGIKLLGKYLLSTADTSVVTAISGSGNDFTIYGKVKSVAGNNSAYFAILLSGVKDGSSIKNLTMGLINIDNTNGGDTFIAEGSGRLVFDADSISQSINFDAVSFSKSNKSILSAGGIRNQLNP